MIDPFGWHEHRVALHVHSRLSDGTGAPEDIIKAADRAGLDVLWLTDHDTHDGRISPGEGYYGHLLFLVGTEITPPQNHYLVFGGSRVAHREAPWQDLVEEVQSDGALGFVAHPDDQGNPLLRLPSYRWTEREAEGFTGLEVRNHLSEWSRTITTIPRGLWSACHPNRGMDEAPVETRALWDRLGRSRRVPALAGVDAHAVRLGARRVGWTVFPYATAFRTVRTHIYTPLSLTGEWTRDRDMLLQGMAEGRMAMVNAWIGTEEGFRFWADQGVVRTPMGSEAQCGAGWILHGLSPIPVHWDVFRNGVLEASLETTILSHRATSPGVWRVELRRPERPHMVWIYSNPIYLR